MRIIQGSVFKFLLGFSIFCSSLFEFFTAASHEFELLHHTHREGMLLVGLFFVLQSLTQTIENLKDDSKYLCKNFLNSIYESRIFKIIFSFLLIASGFTDSYEFLTSGDLIHASWGSGLLINGFLSLSYILLGVSEAGDEYGEEGHSRKALVFQILQMMAALFVMGLAVREEVEMLARFSEEWPSHRLVFLWQLYNGLDSFWRARGFFQWRDQ